jgi:DNA replication protein DnaC
MVFSGDRTRWDAFDWRRVTGLIRAKRVIVDWYNNLPDSGALVLAGNVGSGKTHIALALYDLFGRWRTSFYSEVALAKAIQRTYDDRSVSEDGFIRQALFRPELFILDDLGTYQAKDMSWIQNIYNRIFDDYLTVQGKPLLITTNLPLMDENKASIQSRIGNRSFSRLCGAMVGPQAYVNLFDVSDYRIERFLE